MNIVNGILGLVVAILVGVLSYFYSTFEFIEPKELKKSYIKKDDVTFYDLPYDIQSQYLNKNECNTEASTQEIIKEVVKEKIVYKDRIIEKNKIETIVENIDTTNFKQFKCYSLREGFIYFDTKCQKGMEQFLDKNKDAKYFEVIGVVSQKEIDQLDLDQLQIYGLGEKRSQDAAWEAKQYLNNKKVFGASYHVTSKKNNKGFLLRAYH